ncbi:MAG: hypothetical protein E6K86_07895 [Thaumarchaeota archaeon]|nr:MAG: hypothetical protein E6K86_07895 [Nitrososphaerota archaeon]
MSSQRRVGIALVGVGSIGEVHGSNLANKIHNARLEALVDSDRKRLGSAAGRFGVGKAYTDYDRVLADDQVEAVVLAVPTFLKLDMIKKAAAAGKHIFAEKPMALDLEQADSIAKGVKAGGVKLQVGYQRRFDDAFVKAERAVRDGELGTLELVSSRTRDPPGNPQGWLTDPKLSGGIWLDTITHDFDSIRFLTKSEVTRVYAEAATLVYEQLKAHGDYDNVVVTLRLKNGALAYVDSCAYAPYGYDIRVELVGTKAAAVIEMGNNSSYSLLGTSRYISDVPQSYQERFGRAYRDEMEDFARCIVEDDGPKAGVEEGRAAIRIGLAAWESVKQGRPVTLQGE